MFAISLVAAGTAIVVDAAASFDDVSVQHSTRYALSPWVGARGDGGLQLTAAF